MIIMMKSWEYIWEYNFGCFDFNNGNIYDDSTKMLFHGNGYWLYVVSILPSCWDPNPCDIKWRYVRVRVKSL